MPFTFHQPDPETLHRFNLKGNHSAAVGQNLLKHT